jgi:type IV pilus assembly protein PilC
VSTTYAYKARDRSGTITEGEIESDSKTAAAAALRVRGLAVSEIDEKKGGGLEISFDKFVKVKPQEVTVLARQLAVMISSGLSLLRALYILEEQTVNKKLKATIVSVRQDVEVGTSLSIAMSKHPKIFNDLFVSMVRAGEVGGNLEEVLERVAIQLEKDDNLKRTVKSAMVYPVMIGLFALVILVAMILFIIPIFKKMFDDLGGKLPALTQFMINLSNNGKSHWYLFLAGGIGIVVAFKKWKGSRAGRKQWDIFKLKFPMQIGEIVRKIAVARFTRTLGTLTSSGVPILQALDITARTAGNRVISDPMERVVERVKEGESLAVPLASLGVFPMMVTQMVAVGEETGALDTMLHKIADFYDDEIAAKLKALTSILEPLMMIVIGAVVGVVVIAMYLPLFSVIKQIGSQTG